MEKIKSFTVNHNMLQKGMYISRIDDDIVTYDIRMIKPNVPPFLENAGLHTFEHLFATYVRNSKYSKNVIYVGPMGCRTGFYFIVRNILDETVLNLTKDTLRYINNFTGDIPGQTAKECGNYLDHDLEKARFYAGDMLKILENWTTEKMKLD